MSSPPGSIIADNHQVERGLRPLYLQIVDSLQAMIDNGSYPVGHRFPTEPVLAATFGVSRLTLRNALTVLEHRGLIDRVVGRHGGTFVREPPVERDLTTFAGFAEQMRRSGVVATSELCERARVPAQPDVAEALELENGADVVTVERVRLANGRPVALERAWFPDAQFPGLLAEPLDGALYDVLRDRYGRAPTHAREVFEPVVADRRTARLLAVSAGTPLLLVERTAYDATGGPVEYSRDLFLGERTRVVVWSFEVSEHVTPAEG